MKANIYFCDMGYISSTLTILTTHGITYAKVYLSIYFLANALLVCFLEGDINLVRYTSPTILRANHSKVYNILMSWGTFIELPDSAEFAEYIQTHHCLFFNIYDYICKSDPVLERQVHSHIVLFSFQPPLLKQDGIFTCIMPMWYMMWQN